MGDARFQVLATATSRGGRKRRSGKSHAGGRSATTTGGTWTSAGTNSSVEYNLTGTATTGGRILAQGYFSSTNQSSGSIDILKEALFKFQLERDGLTSTPYELSLLASASSDTSNVHASMDWEEISR